MNPDPREGGIRGRHDAPRLRAGARIGDARAEGALYDDHPDHVDALLLQPIEGALGSLPEMFRIMVGMHGLEGFTHDEIGRTLGKSI